MPVNRNEPGSSGGNGAKHPPRERKTVSTLLNDDCRWPIGDPQHRDFHFCGKHKLPGFPYCEHHVRMSFQAKQLRFRPYEAGER